MQVFDMTSAKNRIPVVKESQRKIIDVKKMLDLTADDVFPRHLLAIKYLTKNQVMRILWESLCYWQWTRANYPSFKNAFISQHQSSYLPQYQLNIDALSDSLEQMNLKYAGKSMINFFTESSTRTQKSFELAANRLGLNVLNFSVEGSSIKKGETILDTALTLSAMRPDLIVIRHAESGSAHLLSLKLDCPVINAGDGSHEHPTQGLLDAATIMLYKGKTNGDISHLRIAICGDVLHSRVARSNISLLTKLDAEVRLAAPLTLLPKGIEEFDTARSGKLLVFHDMKQALADCDIVMMLRLQKERMNGSFLASPREYYHFYGLDETKLSYAKPDALVMHPGPMNRGVEIASSIADLMDRSLVMQQVEMGVAVRMAVIDQLLRIN